MVFVIVGNLMYLVLGLLALWGAWCAVMVWRRVSSKRFRNEMALIDFLEEIEPPLHKGQFEEVEEMCDGDSRALPQLVLLAMENRKLGFAKIQQVVTDRFQRDVLADLEYRLSWVGTVVKSAPMVGLLGTVVGMMGAFAQMAEEVNAKEMASTIMFALITTACGLTIAIPLVLAQASVTVKIRKMEDLAGFGLQRFFEQLQIALQKNKKGDKKEPARMA